MSFGKTGIQSSGSLFPPLADALLKGELFQLRNLVLITSNAIYFALPFILGKLFMVVIWKCVASVSSEYCLYFFFHSVIFLIFTTLSQKAHGRLQNT